jgi:trehalose 6-phosphate phosphatase
MKHLFDEWDTVSNRIGDARLMLFFDFDGTLAAIAPTPGEAVLPREKQVLLEKLAASDRCTAAVVSGRALSDVKQKVDVSGIVYVGNHGLEIDGRGYGVLHPSLTRVRLVLRAIREELTGRLASIEGVVLEDKGSILAVHFRSVREEERSLVAPIVSDVVREHAPEGGLTLAGGKMVIEIRPSIGWNKGTVVTWLLAEEHKRRPRTRLVPLYLGDDRTDEDAFAALAGEGITVLIGEPRESHADYYLRDVREVGELVRRLVERCAEGV